MAGPRPQKKRRPSEAAAPDERVLQGERSKKQSEKRPQKQAPVGEEDFPRGGSDTLTVLERRELTEAARREVEQELANGKLLKSKKASVFNQEDEEDAFFGKQAAALEGKVAKHVDLLRAKNLQAGTRVWGMVLEVTSRGLVVSLPHGLRGHVAPNQASDVLALMHKAQAAAAASGKADGAAGGGVARQKGAALLEAAGGVVPPLTDLFVVGQFVRCVVTEAAAAAAGDGGAAGGAGGGGRSTKHVSLSLLLRDVQGAMGVEGLSEGVALGAVVRSVEDHGYTLSFGIKGASGFLRKRDHEAQFGEGVALQVGGLVDVVVRHAADRRNVIVSCAPGEVAAAVTRAGGGGGGGGGPTGLEALLPGALLNVKVRKVLSNGLLVSFLTFFHGTVDLYHLPAASPAAAASTPPPSTPATPVEWRKAYTEGAKLRARLLFVDPASKRAGLSMLPHLMTLSLPSPVPLLGSVFPGAEVVRLDGAGGPGLLLRMEGLAEGPVTGYCHAGNALEERLEREAAVAELGKRFKPGTKLPARVIGYRLMDGMAAVTVRPSQVNAAVLSYADLAPGMLVPGTVVSVPDRDGDGPLLISVAEGVKGLVPPLHAAEVTGSGSSSNNTKQGKKGGGGLGRIKVKVGERVEVRVLEVDAGARRLTLTLRKGLLAPKAAPLVSAAQAVPGARFHGVVTGFHDRLGVFVSFFGGLSGVAPHGQLGLEPGQSPREVFSLGQVVKATILTSAGGRIKLSLAPKSAAAAVAAAAAAAGAAAAPAAVAAPAGAAAADPLGGLQPGDIADAVVLEMHGGEAVAAATAADGAAAAAAAAGPYYICRLGGGGSSVRARLEAAHLSDHPVVVAAMREVLRPGSKLGRVVVLERLESQRCVRVSRKPSMLAAAATSSLPKAFADVREGAILPGYVASVTPDAVYVRFLAGLTGRAGLPQMSDVFVSDPRQLLTEGQSVRVQVATSDAARQRFTLLLRPSATASTDGAYLLDYFREMQALQALRTEGEAVDGAAAAHLDPAKVFPLGALASAQVQEVREYGIVCDMDEHPDVVGLIPSSHTAGASASGLGPPAVGGRVRGRVLDLVPHQGLVELSLKPEMTAAAKDAAATRAALEKLKPGTSVEAVVEGIRAGEYLILSLPQHASVLSYAAVTDYNTPRPDLVPRAFSLGQRLTATVAALPPDAPAGRVICHVPLTRAAAAGGGGGRANGAAGAGAVKAALTPGSVVQAVVTGIQPHQLDVSIGGGKATGRIHVTEVVDVDVKALLAEAAAPAAATAAAAAAAAAPPAAKKARRAEALAAAAASSVAGRGSPLDGFRLQQEMEAVVLGRLQGGEGHRHGVLDLSLRPSRLATAKKGEPQVPAVALTDLVPGQQLICHVLEVAEDALWLGAGPAVRGRVAALDASLDPDVLSDLPSAFPPGIPVAARVLRVNPKRHLLDLSLIEPSSGTTHGSVASGGSATSGLAAAAAPPPAEGALVMGRILSVSGAGVRVSLGQKRAGSVALTDIHDEWAPDALAGLQEGAFVRARVLGRDGEFAVLSLRPSRGGAVAGGGGKKAVKAGEKAAAAAAAAAAAPELLDAAAVKAGSTVCGYVKRCDARGLFLALDRFRDGRIKLGNLSDGFIEDPPAAFPAGLRLEARVLKLAEDGRLELTLRSASGRHSGSGSGSAAPRVQSLSELHEGQLVGGRVRRVERFGVFVEVEGNPSVVGLAHISELADGQVKDINAAFKPKQSVRALVTKIDLEANRLSLSLKPSRLKQAVEAQAEEGPDGKAGGGVGKAGGTKRRRGADIDEEIAEAAAEEAAEEEEAAGSSGEGGGEEEAEHEAGDPGSDVDVDDVDMSEEDDDDDEEGGDGGAADSKDEEMEAAGGSSDGPEDEEGEEEEEEEEAGGRAGLVGAGPGSATAGNLDLTAPWGELLLADDPRVGGGAGAGGDGSAGAAADGDGGDDKGRKLSKGQKKRLKEQREQEIRAAELARLSGSSAPASPADFERLVLASPNSSFVWIKFMAAHLSLGDVDAARRVAQRALDTIHYREEGEKFNVWVAWLNLENAYGSQPSPEEAAMELLRKALQYTDQKKMYLAALGIFERSGRDELAEQLLRTLTKKFGSSAKVWARAIERALQKGDGESARKLLERSLQSLPARKHIKSLVRAALSEFRLGSAERGRGILEGVLRNYPRRLDLWNIYIDQELKAGEQQRIRALFERATHLPLPPKKMKFLFRRYLDYEKDEGDAAAVEHVKRRAMEFVESSLKA